jgi:two-component system, OmpR family, KDP operon response regulator KdpE
MSALRIPLLVVDDEPPIRRLLRISLGAQGYRILEAATGQDVLDLLAHEVPEVMLLDLGLPDLDGLEVIRRVRASGMNMAIIVLSSRGDERGKVDALDLGADDYVTKPFGMAELVARIRTSLRHRLQTQGAEALFQSGDLTVDLTRRLVSVRGVEVKLSNKEWDILRFLVIHAGKVLTHRVIMQAVWGPKVDVQYLRIYVRQLRQKLEQDPGRPCHILTETGIGYRLQVEERILCR